MAAENRILLQDVNRQNLLVAEQTTMVVTATMKDDADAPIPLAALSVLTLTIYSRDAAAHGIVNAVDHVNILNTGRGVIHATSGLLTLTLLPADNAILDDTLDQEYHRLLIEGTYSGGKSLKFEIEFPVRNLVKVS